MMERQGVCRNGWWGIIVIIVFCIYIISHCHFSDEYPCEQEKDRKALGIKSVVFLAVGGFPVGVARAHKHNNDYNNIVCQ